MPAHAETLEDGNGRKGKFRSGIRIHRLFVLNNLHRRPVTGGTSLSSKAVVGRRTDRALSLHGIGPGSSPRGEREERPRALRGCLGIAVSDAPAAESERGISLPTLSH